MGTERQELGSRRDDIALAIGSITNGLAAYVYILIGTQAIGAAAFAPVSILWTIWSFAAAVLTFPIQHWVIRTNQATGGEGQVRRASRSVGLLTLGAVILTFVLTAALRDPLFGSPGLGLPTIAAIITGSAALLGLGRGLLAARGRFVAASVVIAGENVIRVVFAALVILAGGGSLAYAAAMATGVLILAAVPRSLIPQRSREIEEHRSLPMIAEIAGGTLIAQVILTSPPVTLALLNGDPHDITALFATAAVVRAPYLISLGIALRGTARLTWLAFHRPSVLPRIARLIGVATIACAVVGSLLGGVLLPPIIGLVFGAQAALASGPTAMVVAGTVLAIGSLAMTLILIAVGHTFRTIVGWTGAALAGIVAVAISSAPPLHRTLLSFTIAEVVAFVLLVALTITVPGFLTGTSVPAKTLEGGDVVP